MSTLAEFAEPRSRDRDRALPRRTMLVPAAIVAAMALAIAGGAMYRALGAPTGDVRTMAVANADRIDRL